MKKILLINLIVLLVFCTQNLSSQTLTTPRVSPPAKLEQTIGLTEVSVKYSRPQVILNGKDRTGKIWGQQIAYGLQEISFASQGAIPWRAGANENTVISFSHDVKVEGKPLAAGSYGLHMIIHENEKATVIFSENISSWGSFWYNEEEDALRVDVPIKTIDFTNVLTIDFVDLGLDYGVMALSWEKKQIPFKIEVDTKNLVLQSFRDELRGVAGFSWQGPNQAAAYCMNNNFNHEEALGWVERSISNNRNFQNVSTKGGLLMQMQKMDEALATIDEAAQMANTNQLNALGYQMMQLNHIDKAIHYFKLNVERNPKVANCYDSLGEAYLNKGENQKAIENFKKSLSLDPPPFVKANSIKNLKKLGVDVEQ